MCKEKHRVSYWKQGLSANLITERLHHNNLNIAKNILGLDKMISMRFIKV